jgi:hypothetical protein
MTSISAISDTVSSRFIAIVLIAVALTSPVCADESGLVAVLEHSGRRAEDLWQAMTAVTCVETVVQRKVDGKGKTIAEARTTSDYLLGIQLSGTDFTLDESRIEKGKRATKTRASLLSTSGFAVLAFIFHPYYQSSYEFSDRGLDSLNGLTARRIGFTQISGQRSPSVLVLKDREYPLVWQGTAWLRSDTHELMQVEAGLASAMEDVGLLELKATVKYAPMRFRGEPAAFWLPSSAVIEAATRRQRWVNTHVFSDYQRFNVDTVVRTAGDQ